MSIRIQFLALVLMLTFSEVLRAQDNIYTVPVLAQEKINVSARPQASGVKEIYAKEKGESDTTLTLYGGGSIDFSLYFVHGEEYHHILNPNPTGLLINGQHFVFYCSVEMGLRTNTANFLDIYEFSYLDRKFLCFFNYREDCILSGCRYRCYNLYDITDPDNILPYSFASIFSSEDSFGDFNNDGIIDFVRAAPHPPKDKKDLSDEELKKYGIFTAYTVKGGKIKQLKNEGSAYYLSVKGTDESLERFEVLEADWFIPVKDASGEMAERKPYFAPYISFDPKNNFLYDTKGYRVEKQRWVIHTADFTDLDGALEYCDELKELYKFEDLFIMIDQYNRALSFMVMAGNYQSKEKAEAYLQKLKDLKIEGELINIQKLFWMPDEEN